MAGHSKWANIKHRKAAQDAKRGKLFTKLIRELTVAAKQGGSLVEDNPRLRSAVDKALAANMTRDTIDRAIARGAGDVDQGALEELTYEGYAPGGVAVLIEAMTDNRNRTAAEVRHAFSKRGGNLGTDGSVAYLFSRKGSLTFTESQDDERLFEVALEAGAEDLVIQDDGSIEVITPWQDMGLVKAALIVAGLVPDSADVSLLPSTTISLENDAAVALLELVDALEDLDDVQNVYTNADIAEEVLERFY